jgi:L-rhamnose isomerase
MAEFVGAFAASHAPLIARDWDRLPEPLRERITRSYASVGERLAAARPDILIEVAPDHWTNFFINNLPSVCIGIGGSRSLRISGTIAGIGSRFIFQSGRQKP